MLKLVNRWSTPLVFCLVLYLVQVSVSELFQDESALVDEWLDQNDLGEYKEMFREYGISTLSGCGSPEAVGQLPELPPAEERRLRLAALALQQRLVLRQWLATHGMHHFYSKLAKLGVSSLEDVYWVEDAAARHALGARSLDAWTAARRTLPTKPASLAALKDDLWTTIVKNSKHQDAWTWGGMLVVSLSVCGLVTLAAMTQPALAPEAKHSLLRYVTGKYLHPPGCTVEFGWEEPQTVGETVSLTVACFQRNGQPYPVSDADELGVAVMHGTSQVVVSLELGAAAPERAHTARASFTPRVAGLYLVSVTIAGIAVSGSPFRRRFGAGRCVAARSVVRLPAAAPRRLALCRAAPAAAALAPRDAHGNPAPLTARQLQDFAVKIVGEDEWCKDLGGDETEPVDPLTPDGGGCGDLPGDHDDSKEVLSEESGHETLSEGRSRDSLDELADEADEADGADGAAGAAGAEEAEQPRAWFTYDAVNLTAALWLQFPRAGVYRATVTYCGEVLLNGEFEAVVLNPSAFAAVQRAVGDGDDGDESRGMRFQARQGRRRLALEVRGRRVAARGLLLGFIPRRAAAFRVCGATRLVLGGRRGAAPPAGVLTLDDGQQPPLRAWLPRRDLLVAAAARLLAADAAAQPDSFAIKQQWVYSALRRARGSGERGERAERGEPAELDRPVLRLRVRRDDLLRSSLKATAGFRPHHWSRDFHVSFEGEQGVDWGGVRREWFSLLCGQLFDAGTGLFVPLSEGAARVHPNPHRPPHLTLKHYELAGKVVGKCLYESALGAPYRQFVRARLTRSFLAQLIGLRVDYQYFEHDDPELYRGKVQWVLREDLAASGAELWFSDELYRGGRLCGVRDLVPGGAALRVTNSTKHVYLERLAAWRLAGGVRREVRAFLRGLRALVPARALAPLSAAELELLLCGRPPLRAADWRAAALLGGGGGSGWARTVGWFWAAVGSLTAAERARLLHFATGCDRLPPAGFQELRPRFQLSPGGAFGALPSAHTCFNQLCLPEYESYEHLRRALLCAIHEGAEGFALV